MNGNALLPPCPPPESATDPAFLLALDRDAIAGLVQQHLARDASLLALAPDYLRWKQGDGALVGYRARLHTVHGAVDSYVTVRTATAPRLAAEAARLAHRAGEQWGGLAAQALLPDAKLLLAFPIDRAMHDLRRLVQPSKLRTLVAAACPGVVPPGLRLSKSRSTFRLARYKPERRAVLQWRLGCVASTGDLVAQPAVWVRCHAAGTARPAVAAAGQAAAAGVACPVTLAVVHDRLAIEGHVDGRPWSPVPGDGPDHAAVDTAARTVARLHASAPPRGLPQYGAVQELDRALRATEDLGRLSAMLGSRARALGDRLAAQVPRTSGAGFAHGDLHAGQVLLREHDAALCDFDRACTAPAAFDLATFHAHCLLADPQRGDELAAAFDSAYAQHRPLPPAHELAWWTACALLRAATLPFRSLRCDWPATTAALLAAAATRLLPGERTP